MSQLPSIPINNIQTPQSPGFSVGFQPAPITPNIFVPNTSQLTNTAENIANAFANFSMTAGRLNSAHRRQVEEEFEKQLTDAEINASITGKTTPGIWTNKRFLAAEQRGIATNAFWRFSDQIKNDFRNGHVALQPGDKDAAGMLKRLVEEQTQGQDPEYVSQFSKLALTYLRPELGQEFEAIRVKAFNDLVDNKARAIASEPDLSVIQDTLKSSKEIQGTIDDETWFGRLLGPAIEIAANTGSLQRLDLLQSTASGHLMERFSLARLKANSIAKRTEDERSQTARIGLMNWIASGQGTEFAKQQIRDNPDLNPQDRAVVSDFIKNYEANAVMNRIAEGLNAGLNPNYLLDQVNKSTSLTDIQKNQLIKTIQADATGKLNAAQMRSFQVFQTAVMNGFAEPQAIKDEVARRQQLFLQNPQHPDALTPDRAKKILDSLLNGQQEDIRYDYVTQVITGMTPAAMPLGSEYDQSILKALINARVAYGAVNGRTVSFQGIDSEKAAPLLAVLNPSRVPDPIVKGIVDGLSAPDQGRVTKALRDYLALAVQSPAMKAGLDRAMSGNPIAATRALVGFVQMDGYGNPPVINPINQQVNQQYIDAVNAAAAKASTIEYKEIPPALARQAIYGDIDSQSPIDQEGVKLRVATDSLKRFLDAPLQKENWLGHWGFGPVAKIHDLPPDAAVKWQDYVEKFYAIAANSVGKKDSEAISWAMDQANRAVMISYQPLIWNREIHFQEAPTSFTQEMETWTDTLINEALINHQLPETIDSLQEFKEQYIPMYRYDLPFIRDLPDGSQQRSIGAWVFIPKIAPFPTNTLTTRDPKGRAVPWVFNPQVKSFTETPRERWENAIQNMSPMNDTLNWEFHKVP